MEASPPPCEETGGETGAMAVKTRPDLRDLGSDALSSINSHKALGESLSFPASQCPHLAHERFALV